MDELPSDEHGHVLTRDTLLGGLKALSGMCSTEYFGAHAGDMLGAWCAERVVPSFVCFSRQRFRAFISPPYSLFFFLVKRIGRFGFGCCDCDVFSVRLTDGPDQLSPRDGVTNPQWRADGAARG